MPSTVNVSGHCPACGNESLWVDVDGGPIRCWGTDGKGKGCPNPGAADALLNDPTGNDHIIHVAEDGSWAGKHPMIERLGDLFSCVVPEAVFFAAHQAGMERPGWYRVGPYAELVFLGEDRPW